jgi:hypothetical protein
MNWRFWRFWGKKEFEDAGEKARRIHGQWLTVALSSNRKYPSIPVRPVTQGGFDPLLSRPNGEARAAQWWDAAFQRMDRVESLDDNLPDLPSEDLPPR